MFEPHQQRVIDEKRELDEKATKLSDFIGNSPVFDSLDADEQERMKEQCEVMWQYSEILKKRIMGFIDKLGLQTINERDEAEDAADKMASLILGEPIDWSDHQDAWRRAIEKVSA